MVLNKIPTFDEVKNWVGNNTATSVNGKQGDVSINTSSPITKTNSLESFTESNGEYNGYNISYSNGNIGLISGGVETVADFSDGDKQPVGNWEFSETNSTFDVQDGNIDGNVLHHSNSYGDFSFKRNTGVKMNSFNFDLYSGSWSPGSNYDGLYLILSGDNGDIGKLQFRDDGTILLNGNDTGLDWNNWENDRFNVEMNLDWGNENVSFYFNGNFKSTENFINSSNYVTEFYSDILAYNNVPYDIDNIEEDISSMNQGEAKVGWPSPSDISEWDIGTFTKTEDGETVNIYVEENDGSGWTEIAGPISRGHNITASSGSNIRYRVEISRASSGNNPQLNSIYRRYKV